MGQLIGGVCCAVAGVLVWEGVQWYLWGPPAWLPGWVPVGKRLDPDPEHTPLYDEPPLIGDEALAMLRAEGLPASTWGSRLRLSLEEETRPTQEPAVTWTYHDPADEVTEEPLSADAAGGADLHDPADQAVAEAMNAATTIPGWHTATSPEQPDWMTGPARGTSKKCPCGERVPASKWNTSAPHIAHRRQARADLDAAMDQKD